MKLLRIILALPTYIFVLAGMPYLPSDHPWKGRKFTFKDWAENSTALNLQFGFVMWISIVNLVLLAYKIWSKS